MTAHRDSVLLTQDGARPFSPPPDRYQAVAASLKFCLTCDHWARFHPGHGPCVSYHYNGHRCPCTEFNDPEPGRPDQVYTREQVDRMNGNRWEARKDRIFLLKDGRYGLWDQWSAEDWKAKPGQVPQEPPTLSGPTQVPPQP